MKKLFSFLIAISYIVAMTSCSSGHNEEPELVTIHSYNTIGTRNGGTTTSYLNDKDLEIAKADLIGAFEGAYKGLDYAMKQNLDEESALVVVITSAILHGAARSHQAYINYDRYHAAFEIANISDSNDMMGLSTININEYRQNLVRVSESKYVNNAMKDWTSIDQELYTQYPNAVKVGHKHNAILSILDTQLNMQALPTYENVLASLPKPKADYLESLEFRYGVNTLMQNPFKFYNYDDISDTDAHCHSKRIISKFMDEMTTKGRTLEAYHNNMIACADSVASLTNITELEKESIYIGLIVGKFSARYWMLHN